MFLAFIEVEWLGGKCCLSTESWLPLIMNVNVINSHDSKPLTQRVYNWLYNRLQSVNGL